jgi:hypothetical protein
MQTAPLEATGLASHRAGAEQILRPTPSGRDARLSEEVAIVDHGRLVAGGMVQESSPGSTATAV